MSAATDGTVAYVALGSNLGDRQATLRRAVERLGELGQIEAASSVWDTEPVGYVDQPRYLDAVVRLRTTLSPEEMLARLLAIEHDLGRVRSFPNAPRTLDLDLLLHGDAVRSTTFLTLPHPRMHLRAFVLEPLAEIAPDLVVPVVGERVGALLAGLPASARAGVCRIGPLRDDAA